MGPFLPPDLRLRSSTPKRLHFAACLGLLACLPRSHVRGLGQARIIYNILSDRQVSIPPPSCRGADDKVCVWHLYQPLLGLHGQGDCRAGRL